MRELTDYEKKKWFDGNRFEMPEFIDEGTEWTEYMRGLEHILSMGSSYGMSDEFEKLAQIEYLDHYYDEVYYIYMGQWGVDTPEDLGLPPVEKVMARQDRAMELGVEKLTAVRMALDWAMKWRDDHHEDFIKARRRVALMQELARLGE